MMFDSCILVGNGLGMAIDCNYFSLGKAADGVIKELDEASNQHVEHFNLHNLKNEDFHGLEKLQASVASVKQLQNDFDSSLTNVGRGVVPFGKKFICDISAHFGSYIVNDQKYFTFVALLSEYIKSNTSSLITLNYDLLLYRSLLENKIMNGLNGKLIDGFTNDGFNLENLFPHNSEKFGAYIHLHGSPLFYNDSDGNIKKHNPRVLKFDATDEQDHIVLGPTKMKPYLISRSTLLNDYWKVFDSIIRKSQKILIYGYSGGDEHINKLISERFTSDEAKPEITVVEWDQSGNNEVFWKQKFNIDSKTTLNHVPLSNILDYKF